MTVEEHCGRRFGFSLFKIRGNNHQSVYRADVVDALVDSAVAQS